MERRNFVKSLAAGLVATHFLPELGEALTGSLQNLQDNLGKARGERSFWRRVRQEFLLNPDLVHLNCGSVGSSPRLVVDAVANSMYEMEGDPLHNEWGGIGAWMEKVRARAFCWVLPDNPRLL